LGESNWRQDALMKKRLLCVLGVFVAHGVQGEDAGNDYSAYYSSRPDAVFVEPASPREKGRSYVLRDEPERRFVEYALRIDGREVFIEHSAQDVDIAGRRYLFRDAHMLWGAYAPGNATIDAGADVFVTSAVGGAPAALCFDVQHPRSGEANRIEKSFLMLNPPGSHAEAPPVMLGVRGLLAGCRAFIRTAEGHFAYPRNEYVIAADHTRTGLRMTYYMIDGNTPVPTGEVVELRFSEPENPWRFSVLPR
jgi:hypothetical protein